MNKNCNLKMQITNIFKLQVNYNLKLQVISNLSCRLSTEKNK